MGESGRLLTSYVAAVTREVIDERKELGTAPFMCRADWIADRFRAGLLEAMRECIRSGEFSGHVNINKTAMLVLKEDTKR